VSPAAAAELDALHAIFGEDCLQTGNVVSITCRTKGGVTAVLRFSLGEGYPVDCPPAVTILSPDNCVSRGSTEKLQQAMGCYIGGTFDGSEILYSAVLHFEGLLSTLECKAVPTTAGSEGHPCELCVLHLNHMRKPSVYCKNIEKLLCGDCSVTVLSPVDLVSCDCLVREVVLVIHGDVSAFLSRFRASKVDVDSTGRKCYERLATELCRRPIAARPSPGLTIETCSTKDLTSICRRFGFKG
jgi:hypothetical protein